MKKLLVILGPTATGKTDLGLHLAKKFNGDLISCDSRQVYEGLDIGTGKLPSGNGKLETGNWKKGKGFWEIDGVRIWMYDVISPKNQYTAADYVKDASRVIREIRDRGKLPIVVGGTGLYLKALLEGLPNLEIPVDPKLRKRLEKLSKNELQKKLKEIAALRWNSLNKSDKENPRRLIRAIELILTKKPKYDGRHKMVFKLLAKVNVLKIGLTAPRQILYRRIDDRVISRVKQGMIDEAKRLHGKGLSFNRMRQLGLEYGVLADFLQSRINNEELMKMMQNKIHGFVRRQLTWFKKEKEVFWFDITGKDFPNNVEKIITKWYHQA